MEYLPTLIPQTTPTDWHNISYMAVPWSVWDTLFWNNHGSGQWPCPMAICLYTILVPTGEFPLPGVEKTAFHLHGRKEEPVSKSVQVDGHLDESRSPSNTDGTRVCAQKVVAPSQAHHLARPVHKQVVHSSNSPSEKKRVTPPEHWVPPGSH